MKRYTLLFLFLALFTGVQAQEPDEQYVPAYGMSFIWVMKVEF